MYIQTNDKYPIESQRNQKIHVPREVAIVAIYRGEASEVKEPAYGSREYLAFRAEQSARVTAPGPDDTAIQFVDPPTWQAVSSPYSGRPLLLRYAGFETASFEDASQAKACGCPAHILKQFSALKSVPTTPEQVEDAKRAQAEQQARERTARRW